MVLSVASTHAVYPDRPLRPIVLFPAGGATISINPTLVSNLAYNASQARRREMGEGDQDLRRARRVNT